MKKLLFVTGLLALVGILCWPAGATDLETSQINANDRTQFALDKITQDITSTLYDGGGTSNALQVDADTDAIIASGAAVIDAGGANAIDVWLSNPTATQNATFYVAEFSAATPTAITCIRITEVAIPDTDRTVKIDRANWGLTVATDHYVKMPVRVAITPGSYLMMGAIASEGGTWYARYSLRASMGPVTVTANAGTNLDTSALALDASVDGLEGGLGAAADSVATQGGAGSVTAKLRLVTSQLNTIDADTGSILTAIEGAEDELDGTTTGGPLDDIKAVAEGRVIAASGQHLDNAGGGTAASTDYSVTVVASATYRVHAVNGVIYLGILDATADANVEWIVGAGTTEIITIPSGIALHYATDTAGVEGRLARIQ